MLMRIVLPPPAGRRKPGESPPKQANARPSGRRRPGGSPAPGGQPSGKSMFFTKFRPFWNFGTALEWKRAAEHSQEGLRPINRDPFSGPPG
jgi:hypothetical protein